MATKPTLKKIEQIANNEEAAVALFNDNFNTLEEVIQDSVSRSGKVPTNMLGNLDMGDKRIINLGKAVGDNDAVRYKDVKDALKESQNAKKYAQNAENAAIRADASAALADTSKREAQKAEAGAKTSEDNAQMIYDELITNEAVATVHENIADVKTVAADIDNVNTNADNIEDIKAVFDIAKRIAYGNIGDIRATYADVAPEGCRFTDGSMILREDYPELFELFDKGSIPYQTVSEWTRYRNEQGITASFGYNRGSNEAYLPILEEAFVEASLVSSHTVRGAGLPNITGEAGNYGNGTGANYYSSGAMYVREYTGVVGESEDTQGVSSIYGIDASRSSPIYGSSHTVQPKAVVLKHYVVLTNSRPLILTMRPSVATKNALPTTGNINGDIRVVTNEGTAYVWARVSGTQWMWSSIGRVGTSGSSGFAEWGSIEGDIYQQADLQEALSKKLENTSTYTNSFSVGAGAVTQSTSATSVGVSSSSKGSATAVGYQAKAAATGSVAVGRESHAQDSYSVAVGYQAETTGGYSIAVGPSSEAGEDAVALGSGARALAEDSIQIGVGTNEEEGSLKVLDKKLLDAKGHIPPDRLLRTPASLTLNAKQKEIAEEFGVYFAENSVDASLIQDGHFFDSDEGLLKAAVTRYNWDTKINPSYNYSSMSWSVLKFGNKLYAFGDSFRNGTYYCELWTSDDGKTWTRNTNVTDLKSIVVASDSVMVCVTNTGSLKKSDDGETWVNVESFAGTNVTALWYGGGVFLAKGASNSLYVSTDGSVWASVELVDTDGAAISRFDGISFDGTRFIMYESYSNLYTSSDGVNWTKNTSLNRVDFVEYKDGVYIAGKQKHSGATQMYYSTDLNEWTPTSVVKGWGNYASFVVGDYYLIVSQATTEEHMYVSKDGLIWIELEYPKGYYRSPVNYVDGVYYTTAYRTDTTSYGLLGRSEIADVKATFSTVLCSLEDIAVAGEGIEFKPATEQNYSVVGTPTIENNVASNFGAQRCLTTENPFVAEECTRVEMVLVFEMPALASKPILSNDVTSSNPYFRVNTTSTGQIGVQYTDTAEQTKTFMGALGITANTKTWYKCIGDVSDGTFTQFKSTDEGQTWTLISQLSGFTSPSLESGSLLYWGRYGRSTTYFNGKIYLEDSYIKTTSASGEKTLRLVEATGKTEVSATAPEVDLTGYLKNVSPYQKSLAIDKGVTNDAYGIAIGVGDQDIVADGQGAIAIGSALTGETYPTKASGQGAIAIGKNAQVNSALGIAVGFTASAANGVAIGYAAETKYSQAAVSIGHSTFAKDYSVAVGGGAKAQGFYSTALGFNANATATNAIQLGGGTNSIANTMNVALSSSLNVQLLDANGKIPGERMSLKGTTAPTTSTVGSIGQFYVDTATGTGYMCVGVADGVYTWKQITV